MIERTVRVFRSGSEQVVAIPDEFALPGDAAILRVEDGHLTLRPLERPSLLAVLASLETLDETFPDIEDRLAEPIAF